MDNFIMKKSKMFHIKKLDIRFYVSPYQLVWWKGDVVHRVENDQPCGFNFVPLFKLFLGTIEEDYKDKKTFEETYGKHKYIFTYGEKREYYKYWKFLLRLVKVEKYYARVESPTDKAIFSGHMSKYDSPDEIYGTHVLNDARNLFNLIEEFKREK